MIIVIQDEESRVPMGPVIYTDSSHLGIYVSHIEAIISRREHNNRFPQEVDKEFNWPLNHYKGVVRTLFEWLQGYW